jgi:hypothetical protein
MSIPYIALFFAVWILSSLWRPFVVLSWIAFLSQPTAALRKAQLLWTTVLFLALNKDKKWKKTADPAPFFAPAAAAASNETNSTTSDQPGNNTENDTGASTSSSSNSSSRPIVESKTIIFVRHGESNWNETFNKGSDRSKLQFILGFLPGLLKALFYEWYYAVSGRASSSWFYDSPLSEKGYKQAIAVQAFLKSPVEYMTPKEAQVMKILLGQAEDNTVAAPPPSNSNADSSPNDGSNKSIKKKRRSSVLVSSNLRRAIATMACGFQDRLLNNDTSVDDDDQDDSDKIFILQSLQEISFNPDALSITPPYTKVAVDDNIPRLVAAVETSMGDSNDATNSSSSSSDALLLQPARLNRIYQEKIAVQLSHGNKSLQSNGIQRLQAFCHEVFNEPELKDYSAIIAGGHSLWFRSFFQTYLPHATDHIAKRKKLINGGIVACTLQRVPVVVAAVPSSTSSSPPLQEDDENAAPMTVPSTEKKRTKVEEYRYMIDPSSIVVLHGGF